MEVRAITRYVRISPSKAAEISRLIQGKTVTEALAIVEISPRKAARLFAKTLKSAIANAENSDKNPMKKETLKVKKAAAESGADVEEISSESSRYGGKNQKTHEPLYSSAHRRIIERGKLWVRR